MSKKKTRTRPDPLTADPTPPSAAKSTRPDRPARPARPAGPARSARTAKSAPPAASGGIKWAALAAAMVVIALLGVQVWQALHTPVPPAAPAAGVDRAPGGTGGPWFVPTQAPPDPAAGELADYCRNVYNHAFLGRKNLDDFTKQLADLRASTGNTAPADTVLKMSDLELNVGREHLRFGEFQDVFGHLDTALKLAEAAHGPDATLAAIRLQRGVAHLRMADAANCATSTNPYLCLIFVDSQGPYQNQTDVLAAIDDLQDTLTHHPNSLSARWLLNVAHMLLRTYPDGVPAQWRNPPERFAAQHDAPKFENVARKLKVANVDLAGGSVMDDMDNDGFLDLVTTSFDLCQHMHYYHNDGNGNFTDATASAKLTTQLGGFSLQQTDYDNDGNLDLLITRGGWQNDSGRMRKSLVHNNGDGTFTDVTAAAGLAVPAYPSQASSWADYDNDGDLDLYVGNEIGSDYKPFPAQLFRNNGNGTFTDVAVQAGVDNRRMAKSVAWGDYDNDGDPDLYVSNIGPNRLYRNNGDGTFTDVAPELKVQEPADRSFVAWFWDYDNDGWLDIWVGGYHATIDDIAREYLGEPMGPGVVLPRLYHNNGHGGFDDVTQAAGLNRVLLPMGANYGDIDNDGWPDFYLGTGDPDFQTLVPNILFWNDHGRRFLDVTAAAGVGHLPKGHGIAFGDLDNDGDQDILLEAGGFNRGDAAPNALFENTLISGTSGISGTIGTPGTPNHWLTLKLVGTRTNRAAFGARIQAVVDEGGVERSIYSMVDSGGSFGANSLQQEIGLGQAALVKSLIVTWPTSGQVQRFANVKADQFLEVREGEQQYKVLERRRIQLGGGGP